MKKKLRKCLIAVTAILIISSITAYAANSTKSPNSATSEETEVPVVTDEAKVLQEYESDEITENSKKLSIYKLAIYTEAIDEDEISEPVVSDHCKTFYQNTFKEDTKGIVIEYAFCTNQNDKKYYDISYGKDVDVNDEKIKKIIKDAEKTADVDSDWVTLASEQIIDYLVTQEYNIIHADEIVKQEKRNEEIIIKCIEIFFVLVLASIIGFMIHKAVERKKAYDRKLKKLQKAKEKLYKEKEKVESEVEKLKLEIEVIEKWKKTAIDIQPDIERRVAEVYAKAEAEQFSDKYEELAERSVEIKNFKLFSKAIEDFKKLSNLAQSFVTIDMDDVYRKYKEIVMKYKHESEQHIKSVVKKCAGIEEERFELRHAMQYYESLPLTIQHKFNKELLEILQKKHASAEADYKIKYNC